MTAHPTPSPMTPAIDHAGVRLWVVVDSDGAVVHFEPPAAGVVGP